MSFALSNSRAALVIAHPGHELCVYQWLGLTRPLCFVLTDGSGSIGKSRLDSTTRLLQQNAARIGSVYGRLTDVEIYSAIINLEFERFIDLTAELARELVREQIDYVVGDAIENYNPAHDVCRSMINAAVAIANRQMSRPLLNFEISLTHQPDKLRERIAGEVWLDLDEASLIKKLKVAQAYPGMAAEVDRILQKEGVAALQTERLRPVSYPVREGVAEAPYYEIHGSRQVEAGRYRQVLRYNEHVRPLEDALRRYSEGTGDLPQSVVNAHLPLLASTG
jgi:hypothetical protein